MMKKIVMLSVMLSSLMFASGNDANKSNENNESNASQNIADQELQNVLKQEEKFAREQTFYNSETYDFKGSEVNKKSVKKTPIIPMDDPSIDSESTLGMD